MTINILLAAKKHPKTPTPQNTNPQKHCKNNTTGSSHLKLNVM